MTLPAWLLDIVTFAHPGWLVLLAAPPLLWLLRRVRPAALPAVSSLTWFDAVPTTWRVRLRWLPGACRTIAFVLIVIALAGPERITPAREGVRPGLDVLLLMDVSQSMRARDGTPDRLGSAIALSQALVKARPRDRIGVLLFAGDHAIACPLTVDHASVVDRLQAITVSESDEGTAIGVAITGALGRLQTARAARGAIVVVTDGASNTGSPLPEEAARLAARQGMTVMTVGVGRDGLVPFPTELGVVEIPLGIDEPALRRVATAGGGAFVRATDRQAAASIAAALDRIEPAERVVTSRRTAPMGAWLGAAAVDRAPPRARHLAALAEGLPVIAPGRSSATSRSIGARPGGRSRRGPAGRRAGRVARVEPGLGSPGVARPRGRRAPLPAPRRRPGAAPRRRRGQRDGVGHRPHRRGRHGHRAGRRARVDPLRPRHLAQHGRHRRRAEPAGRGAGLAGAPGRSRLAAGGGPGPVRRRAAPHLSADVGSRRAAPGARRSRLDAARDPGRLDPRAGDRAERRRVRRRTRPAHADRRQRRRGHRRRRRRGRRRGQAGRGRGAHRRRRHGPGHRDAGAPSAPRRARAAGRRDARHQARRQGPARAGHRHRRHLSGRRRRHVADAARRTPARAASARPAGADDLVDRAPAHRVRLPGARAAVARAARPRRRP